MSDRKAMSEFKAISDPQEIRGCRVFKDYKGKGTRVHREYKVTRDLRVFKDHKDCKESRDFRG
jgi:hypothetical protein